jgi:hypothetical protein
MKSKVVVSPPGQFDESDICSRKRWRQVQGLANEFWSKWKKQYLQNLQSRRKWTNQMPNMKINDVVVIQDESAHRNQWRLAKIVDVFPSSDDCVRKVKLMLADAKLDSKGKRISPPTYLERPIHKLVLIYRPTEQN